MLYYYTARSSDGQALRGSMRASTLPEALARLSSRELLVSSLDEAGTARGMVSGIFQARVSQTALVALFRSLATLVRAGVSLSRSLGVCIEQCGDGRLREALRSVAAEIQSGISLSEAMLRHPREFPPLSVGAIASGERGGALDEVLSGIAATFERDRTLGKKLVAAMTYPGIVACATLGVMWLLLTTTLPIFENTYAQLHAPMPPILRLLLVASGFSRSTEWIVGFFGIACVLVIVIRKYGKTRHGAAVVEKFQLALPAIGTVLRKIGIARFARLLGMLLKCGVSLHEAIPIVAQAIGSPHLRASIASLRESLTAGTSIAAPLQASGHYDALFLQLVRVGEETGTLDEMLFRIADYYELDVETSLEQLGAALEPIMIVVLGGVVGAAAAAVFIPLYSLIGSMK